MDIKRIDATPEYKGQAASQKPAGQSETKIDTNDYWVAGGKRFGSLNDIGDALRRDKLKMPKSDGLWAAHKTFRPEEGKKLKATAKKFGLGSLAGIGISLGVAALGITIAPLVLIPMMVGMALGGVALGTHEAGKAFESAPQIKEQGTVSISGNKVTFQDYEGNKKTV